MNAREKLSQAVLGVARPPHDAEQKVKKTAMLVSAAATGSEKSKEELRYVPITDKNPPNATADNP